MSAPPVLALPPLKEALAQLVHLIELQLPEMRGSILLLGDDGTTLHTGAAPRLPLEFCHAIDGLQIGPVAGSCGTAAFRREQVIVTDIERDPLWANYKTLALPHGLRASWSTPIFDSEGEVLGTFAMYYTEPRVPTAEELGFTATASLLAANVIVRARAELELNARTATAEAAAAALASSEARMRAMHAEAERANSSKADFLAMLSHELRTPLNAIGGYATLMLDGIPDPATASQQNYLHRIMTGQQHILSLIEAVLTHAKLESGSMAYRITDVRMSQVLDVIDGLLTPQFRTGEIEYDCSECDASLVLHADTDKVIQILLNVLSNSIKFTPPHGRVAISTSVVRKGTASIAVRDTGIGMTREQMEIVFEPYVQFENTLTDKKLGTGLGMPISRGLARGMGGDLTAESEPGAGTEFVLTLPTALDGEFVRAGSGC